ncbi:MAG: hypothetical protein ACYSTL_00150, partial [Planctomycetota bacterium]
SQGVLKTLSFPPNTPADELPGMVHYQVEKELPFPVAEAVIDFTIESHYDTAADSEPGETNESDDENRNVDVLVAAIRLAVLDYSRQLASAAGVKLLRLSLRPYADMRCVSAAHPRTTEQTLALVHVTTDETEIDVIENRSLAFTRSAVKPMGDIAAGNEQELSEGVSSLVAEVTRTLQSYQAVQRGVRIDAALIAGETGVEAAAAEQLSERLGAACEMLEPAKAFKDYREGPVGSEFISALGLAVAHPSDEELPFDFLNPKRPPVQRDMRKVRIITAAAAAAVLLITVFASGSIYLSTKRSEVNRLEDERIKLEKAIKAVREASQRVDAIEQWVQSTPDWLEYWAHLNCVFPSAEDIYLTRLNTNTDGSTTLTVQARNPEAITELSERLSAAGYKFTPGSSSPGRDPHGYAYSTTLRILPATDMKVDLATTQPAERPDDDAPAEEFYRKGARRRRVAPRRNNPARQEMEQEPQQEPQRKRKNPRRQNKRSGNPKLPGGRKVPERPVSLNLFAPDVLVRTVERSIDNRDRMSEL